MKFDVQLTKIRPQAQATTATKSKLEGSMLPDLRVITSQCRRFATNATVRGFNGAIGNTPLVSNLFFNQSNIQPIQLPDFDQGLI